MILNILFRKTPIVDRSTKPSLLTSDGLSLRDVILPTKLMHDFLKLAFSNTMSNKETCGILAGKLERNKLLVTHLLIPEQTGTPDSCTTHNEEDIFDYQDQHNLITLGWIHVRFTFLLYINDKNLYYKNLVEFFSNRIIYIYVFLFYQLYVIHYIL